MVMMTIIIIIIVDVSMVPCAAVVVCKVEYGDEECDGGKEREYDEGAWVTCPIAELQE